MTGIDPEPTRSVRQPVEARHVAKGRLRIVVRVRRPDLIGAQHVPGGQNVPERAEGEAVADHAQDSGQHAKPVTPVVGDPCRALRLSDPNRVESVRPVAYGHGRDSMSRGW